MAGEITLEKTDDAAHDEWIEKPITAKKESASMERKFQLLAKEWRDETSHLSSMTKLVMHPKYQNIIGLGPAVLPILFRELQKNPDHWFWALSAITEEDPTNPEDAGNLRKMSDAWLKWAREKGYL